MGKTICIAGKFNPIHKGHIDHIKKAAKLGDYLYIITHSDEVIRKVSKDCWLTLIDRMVMLRAILELYHINGEVIISIDEDGKSVETLKLIKPDVFAKGGDRTPENMPEDEIKVCQEIECEIVYGVGDLLGSSSKIMEKRGKLSSDYEDTSS